jgi:hypothetical protein
MSVQPATSGRFVILEHTLPPPATPAVHWDLVVEVPGAERLSTWRLAANPLQVTDPIPAERIQDHRRLYLEFEGELTGGRGRVRQIEHGRAELAELCDDEAVLNLTGVRLRGCHALARTGTTLVFRKADPPRREAEPC